MRVTIEDLEALKELNEELEENHIETERAMQDEISTCRLTHRICTWPMPSRDRRERRPVGRAATKDRGA
jgi:hypothetical protein